MLIQNQHFLVLGAGESGVAMARYLARNGADVTVADDRNDPPNQSVLLSLGHNVTLMSGAFDEDLLHGVDVVAVSPGLSLDIPLIKAVRAKNIPLISEISLFIEGMRRLFPTSRLIAITGSNGKTTVTALTAHLLNGAKIPAIACGNISPSALDALMGVVDGLPQFPQNPQVWVLEISSFQLETTAKLGADAALILNISEDHLDRHGNMSAYVSAKARIFEGCKAQVLNADEMFSNKWQQHQTWQVRFGLSSPENSPKCNEDYGVENGWITHGKEKLFSIAALPIAGAHNVSNALAALSLCDAIGVAPQRVLPHLQSFRGLPHRVEKIAEIFGVDYFDDSKGTNVGATVAAISGLGKKVCVILGGEGKGQDFSPLKEVLAKNARAIALIGRDAKIIEAAILGIEIPVQFCQTMEEAVLWCAQQTQPGDAVLLSPACASFDMFRNYAHRAEVFCAAVSSLQGELA